MTKIIAAILFIFLYTESAIAKDCSSIEAEAAENAVDTLDSWASIFSAYKRYKHCDDAAIAEGFTDKVVHLLATQWGSLHQVQQLVAQDASFQLFIVKHINASADASELDRIRFSAMRECPALASLLCKQIAGAASER